MEKLHWKLYCAMIQLIKLYGTFCLKFSACYTLWAVKSIQRYMLKAVKLGYCLDTTACYYKERMVPVVFYKYH